MNTIILEKSKRYKTTQIVGVAVMYLITFGIIVWAILGNRAVSRKLDAIDRTKLQSSVSLTDSPRTSSADRSLDISLENPR